MLELRGVGLFCPVGCHGRGMLVVARSGPDGVILGAIMCWANREREKKRNLARRFLLYSFLQSYWVYFAYIAEFRQLKRCLLLIKIECKLRP